jgi:hypothetical protein
VSKPGTDWRVDRVLLETIFGALLELWPLDPTVAMTGDSFARVALAAASVR